MRPEEVECQLADDFAAEGLVVSPEQLEACLKHLEDERYLEDVFEVPANKSQRDPGDHRAWKGLYEEARDFLQLPKKPQPYVPRRVFQSHEIERAVEISRDEARKLGRVPRIRRFRAKHFNGQVLDEDHAKALLEKLDSLKLPSLVDRIQLRRFSELNDNVIAEGGDEREYGWLERDDSHFADPSMIPNDVFIEFPELNKPRIVSADDPPEDPALVTLNAELHDLAKWIADRIGWTRGQAVWHLVTGRVPLHLPVHVEIMTTYRLGSTRSTITVVAQNWVSHRTVDRVYREAQKRLAESGEGPLASRSGERRARSVYRFVVTQEALGGQRPPLAELLESWNSAYGDKLGRFDSTKRFSEAFKREEKRRDIKSNRPRRSGRA